MGILALKDTLRAEAFIHGRSAGKLGASATLNQHSVGSYKYIEWERGRISGLAVRATEILLRGAKPCPYVRGVACDCGGRGTCLDVA